MPDPKAEVHLWTVGSMRPDGPIGQAESELHRAVKAPLRRFPALTALARQ